jgi:IPT/TIG domain-containing protein
MSDWQIMGHDIELPIAYDSPVTIPSGWEPLSALPRQGNKAVILCRRLAAAPPSGAPVLTSITPTTLPAGSTPATIDVIGSGFDASCTINADGVPRATFFLDSTHLQYTARPDLATSGQVVQITVVNDAGTSSALPFTYS